MTQGYLAAYVNGSKSLSGVYFWSGVLIALVLLAFYGYSMFTRWMKAEDAPTAAKGFTLSDMRELHRQGKMSNEEFETARAKMVAAAKRMTDGMPAVLPKKPGRPGSDASDTSDGE